MAPRSKERIWNQMSYDTWDFDHVNFQRTEQIIRSKDIIHDSESHDFQNLKASGPDKGGRFHCTTHEYEASSTFVPALITGWHYSYFGDQLAWQSNVSPDMTDTWQPLLSSTDHALNVIGASFIRQVLPTNSESDLIVFLGELKEGLPRLGIETFRRRAGLAKSAGSDYLNYEFGWKPLVHDLKKFAGAVRDQENTLLNFERNSGKVVRRKRSAPTVSDSYEVKWLAKPKPSLPYWIDAEVSAGQMTAIVTTSYRHWFSGAFTYYIPKQGSRETLSKANKLFGTGLTPDVLWELSPWSWAIDWVSNTGNVLHNISAFHRDGLVMPYAYVMEEKTIKVQYNLEGVYYHHLNGGTATHNFSQTFTTKVMKRLRATPYGFGFLPEIDFSTRQKSIIAALGLTRTSGRRR